MIPIFALISLAMAATTAPQNGGSLYTVEECISNFTKARKNEPVCDYNKMVTYPNAWQAKCLQLARGL